MSVYACMDMEDQVWGYGCVYIRGVGICNMYVLDIYMPDVYRKSVCVYVIRVRVSGPVGVCLRGDV